MMKSFFKKLAFVMALAMVVSAAAPAASASAAVSGVSLQGTKTIVDTYELAKVGATVDFSFQGAPKDWKTTFKWASSNEAVATVDKAGVVTAVAEGTAIISITAGADSSYYEEVAVTVKAAKKADAFTVAQTTTTKFEMTLASKKDVKAEDVAVVMMINDVEAPIPVKSVKVEDKVATVELFSEFIDATKYTVTYAGETKEFTASVGDIARVSFNYWSVEEGDNVAFVSTDEDPIVTTLEYQLFDANGVDVTEAYAEDDLSVEYALAADSDKYEVLDNELTFFEAGAAVVEITVTYFDEEGDEIEKKGNNVVVATRRPALAHSIVKAGFINTMEDPYIETLVEGCEAEMVATFTKDKDSFFWKDNAFLNKWTYGDDGDFHFAALVKDNRGNEVVTGINNYGEGDKDENKDGVIYPYGYFKFASSNEDVVEVDGEGELAFWDAGTASIITYFVDTTGEEEKEIFVGATKITVSPERYPATYAFNSTSVTVASTVADKGGSTVADFVFTVYDQYGKNYELVNGVDDITVETTSKDETVPLKGATSIYFSDSDRKAGYKAAKDANDCDGYWCGNSKGNCHYHIKFDGNMFEKYLLDNDKSSVSIPYSVTFDKDENKKLTSAETAKIKLIVKDTTEEATAIANGTAEKFYIAQGWRFGSSKVDAVINYAKNFKRTDKEAAEKHVQVQFRYLASSNGFQMGYVPEENLVDITALAKSKNMPKTGEAGKIYFVVEAPKDAYNADGSFKNWSYKAEEIDHWGGKLPNNVGVSFRFNDTEGGELSYAVTGTYKLTAYYVKNTNIKNGEGNLSKFGTYSIPVTNSQPDPKFVGYDDKLGNKTNEELSANMNEDDILDIVKENLVFSYDGKEIDWEAEDEKADADQIKITFPQDDKETYYTVSERKIRVNKVLITVPVDDGDTATNYTYSKLVTVKKSIEYDENAEDPE